MVHHGQLYQLSWIEDHFKLHPQKGTISKGKWIIFQPFFFHWIFGDSWVFGGVTMSFCRQSTVTPPRQIAPEKLHGPFLCLLTKFAMLVIFSRVNITFFLGGVLKNDHSTTVLHNWSIKDLKRRQSVTSSSHLFAQLIVDRGKPLQLYLQKPAFCHALKTSVIVHY